MTLLALSKEEETRARLVINGFQTTISNLTNANNDLKNEIIALTNENHKLSYELYISKKSITNLNRQIDLKIEIARQDKVKLVGYSVGAGLVIGIVLRSLFN